MSSTTTPHGSHRRENNGLLADAERRTLVWIAHRLPRTLHSDHLTAMALVAMFAAAAAFAAFPFGGWAGVAVAVALAVNWFGDSLDGTVARVRNQQRPRYGYYVDHVIDLAGTFALLGGLACSGVMTPIVAFLTLGAYLLVSAEVYLATHAGGVFRMSFMGVGPTELRILVAVGALQASVDPWVPLGALGSVRIFDLGGLIGFAGMLAAFVLSSVRTAMHLAALDPRPVRGEA
jgi:phosphatidylglycerophosphate synthase